MNNKVEAPILKKKKNLSPVWILPVLAAVLGLWLLVNYIQERGHDIVVTFPSATGIEANKTFVRYQGIIVGQVTKVSLARDNISVNVSIRMQNAVDNLLRKNTRFWVVSPRASLTGIDGLDALFSGNYIAMAPGDGKPTLKFTGAIESPPLTEHKEGLLIHIAAKQRGSLDVGSGLYYQQVKVGEIVDFNLNDSGDEVIFDAFVEPEYQLLVRQDSRFWNISGVKAEVNRSKLAVEFNSLATLIAGGISFNSPKQSEPAQESQLFNLFAGRKDALPRQRFTLTADNAKGLNVGSAIRYRGLELGQVEAIELSEKGVVIDAWVEQKYRHLLTSTTRFSQVGASFGLDGVEHLDTMVFGDFIRLWPNNGSGQFQSHFELLPDAPIVAEAGKTFVLTQKKLTGVTVGAPIRFRGAPVGEVLDISLAPKGVEISILIDAEHQHLVRENSQFWLAGAIDVKADLANLQLTAAPLTDVLSGGIEFSSSEQRPVASANSRFALQADRESALLPKPHRFTLKASSLSGINPGAPVLYRDLEVGKIKEIALAKDQLSVVISIADRYRYLVNSNTRFWHYSGVEIEGSLAGVKVRTNPLISMVRGGLALGHVDGDVSGNMLTQSEIYEDEQHALSTGKLINLTLAADGNISVNAPIRYLGHKVGTILSVELSKDLTKQVISAELLQPWADTFSRSDSAFYLVQPKVSLAGIRHVETILEGNHIAVLPGVTETLSNQFSVATEEPLQTAYGEGLRLVLNQRQLGSLHIGSPVLYRQIRVGEVIHTRLTANGDSVDIEIQLKPQYQHLVNKTSRFWNASGVDIDFGVFTGADIKTESLETLLAGGIAFATQDATNDDNRLESGKVLRLYQNVKPSWLEWRPKFNAQPQSP